MPLPCGFSNYLSVDWSVTLIKTIYTHQDYMEILHNAKGFTRLYCIKFFVTYSPSAHNTRPAFISLQFPDHVRFVIKDYSNMIQTKSILASSNWTGIWHFRTSIAEAIYAGVIIKHEYFRKIPTKHLRNRFYIMVVAGKSVFERLYMSNTDDVNKQYLLSTY